MTVSLSNYLKFSIWNRCLLAREMLKKGIAHTWTQWSPSLVILPLDWLLSTYTTQNTCWPANILNTIKAIQLEPRFEVHALFVSVKMDLNLKELKRSNELVLGFYRQLQDFLFSYLKTTRSYWMIHGDIKPRLALERILILALHLNIVLNISMLKIEKNTTIWEIPQFK